VTTLVVVKWVQGTLRSGACVHLAFLVQECTLSKIEADTHDIISLGENSDVTVGYEILDSDTQVVVPSGYRGQNSFFKIV
jgi:hypothetical protein